MLLGQKIKGTLAFNHRVVAQNVFALKLFKALEQRSFYSHQSSGTSIQRRQTNKLRTMHHSKEKL
jgi:hypothetical protein